MPLIETKGAASSQGFGQFAKTGAANWIEDCFSCFLYTGNGSTQTITNGIDLSTNGGLVWVKSRSVSGNNWTQDTARGVNSVLYPNLTNAAGNPAGTAISSFDSSGFSLGTNTNTNNSGTTYASWTFRKQPKFFDVVTYTGNGANRTIAHSLGSVPGCIIVKRTDASANWAVRHANLGNDSYLVLNSTGGLVTDTTVWNNAAPTAAAFPVGTSSLVNANGGTYVAYIFAHNAGGFGLTGTDNVISCGAYGGNSSATGPVITLGYEPQWVMIKSAVGTTGNWNIFDNMRGMTVAGQNDAYLEANTSDAEALADWITPTATGFQLTTADAQVNSSANDYIYIAIRRGPMRTPTSGTSVYSTDTFGATTPRPPSYKSNSVVDLGFYKGVNSSSELWVVADRLRGPRYLEFASTNSETSLAPLKFDYQRGWYDSASTSSSFRSWMFSRAPGFFDTVCYTGTGSNMTINHNLGVAPELLIIKTRNGDGRNWLVGTRFLSFQYTYAILNDTAAAIDWSYPFIISAAPTASSFSLASGNVYTDSGRECVAYLFASCPGVSKVGSYTGTGTTLQINCGFTGGARFVLIKRTDTTGDWYMWDSARGIVAANDPYLMLNNTNAEVTNTDWVDTHSPGFELSNAAGNLVNTNGGTYIFLAIA